MKNKTINNKNILYKEAILEIIKKNKNIDIKLGIYTAIFGILGAIIGANIAIYTDVNKLRKLFGVFLIIIVLHEIYSIYKGYKKEKIEKNKK